MGLFQKKRQNVLLAEITPRNAEQWGILPSPWSGSESFHMRDISALVGAVVDATVQDGESALGSGIETRITSVDEDVILPANHDDRFRITVRKDKISVHLPDDMPGECYSLLINQLAQCKGKLPYPHYLPLTTAINAYLPSQVYLLSKRRLWVDADAATATTVGIKMLELFRTGQRYFEQCPRLRFWLDLLEGEWRISGGCYTPDFEVMHAYLHAHKGRNLLWVTYVASHHWQIKQYLVMHNLDPAVRASFGDYRDLSLEIRMPHKPYKAQLTPVS